MTIDDLISSIPADLRMAIEASLDDPGMRCGCEEMRTAMRASRDRRRIPQEVIESWSEAFEAWIAGQEFIQMMAADVSAEIEENYPVDISSDVLPEWIVEWWAPVLRNPWSERLDEAVIAAREWLG